MKKELLERNITYIIYFSDGGIFEIKEKITKIYEIFKKVNKTRFLAYPCDYNSILSI